MEIFNQIILMMSIISIATAAGWILEKSGTMAIGIESLLTISAFSFLAFYKVFGGQNSAFVPSIIMAMIISGITGVFLQVLITFLKGNQALVTIGFNIVLPAMLFLISNKFTEGGFGLPIPDMLSMMSHGYNLLFVVFLIISIVIIAIISFFVFKTKFGLTLNAIGENPHVIQSSGKNIFIEKLKIAFIAGVVASFAGVFLVFFWSVWTNGGYYNGLSAAAGLGYISLGIIILSKWKFKNYLFVTFVMSILIGLFYNFLYIYNKNIPLIFIMRSIPYLIPMVILPFISKTNGFPTQLGIPFKKNKRG
ncbi:ABC transporter permease subunit [Mycoplasma todarodis]|uniref:ABC transporter permease subunit n=1 Tax=Mycoplasma todarodis TaxID=1937191 RepID=UPI003B2AC4D0